MFSPYNAKWISDALYNLNKKLSLTRFFFLLRPLEYVYPHICNCTKHEKISLINIFFFSESYFCVPNRMLCLLLHG